MLYQRKASILGARRYGKQTHQPLLLLHGFGASALWWSRAIDGLAGYQMYTLDLCYRRPVAHMAQEVLMWMQQEHIECCVLAGHSLGSQIARSIAAQAPERITQLILVNPAIAQTEVSVWQWLKRCRAARRISVDLPPGRRPFSLKHAHPNAWRIVLRSLRQAEQILPQIQNPTLILWGTRDPLFPVRYAFQFQQAFTQSLLIEVDAGHSLMYERSTVFCEHVQQFLQQHA